MKNIVEIRVHSRLVRGGFYITLFFDDQTQFLYKTDFENEKMAEAFSEGIRQGFAWAKKGVKLIAKKNRRNHGKIHFFA